MTTARGREIKDTAKSKNTEINLVAALTLDQMEAALNHVAGELGLYISHTTVLGRRQYPGNRHWHLKQEPKIKGCLDVTYWPDGPLLWVSVRNSEPSWVHDAGHQLYALLEQHLFALARQPSR